MSEKKFKNSCIRLNCLYRKKTNQWDSTGSRKVIIQNLKALAGGDRVKVIAFNGSPRKKWNTATLLNRALEGAASQGADTELVHLYDIDFKGCYSCFACKIRDGKSYGHCGYNDGLLPILKKIESEADAIILGSPIYYLAVTGVMRSFLERLMFPYSVYSMPPSRLTPKKINAGMIYTMNTPSEEMMIERGLKQHLSVVEEAMRLLFGSNETLYSCDTYQFSDYSKVVADRFDAEQKKRVRDERFPIDCEKAFQMGARLVTG